LWVDLAKRRELRDYPLLVDLELSSKCNLHCPMCYTITEEFLSKVARKYMEIDLYKKVIDEIAGKVFAVRLSLRGESTLNRYFIEAVAYAKQKGIKEVSTLTHGKKFTGDYLRAAVKAGIDWITISIDGTGETYNKIRHPLTWETTLGRLKEIKALKDELGVSKPVIKVQGIWPAIRANPTAYYEALEPFSDLIAYNPLIDYLRNDSEIVYEENFSCPQLYQRLVVGSDGKVMMCSNDEDAQHPVGDANLQTIHEIWHGDAMNKVRELHSRSDGFKELGVCRNCYYPRKAVPDETANVSGRKITIENYVNRAQQVGK
jgi:radical SAM protein with 4Fe4S-binding SPASM domain